MGLAVIEALKEANVHSIGTSAGGRDILAIEYGEKEEVNHTTDNLQSALMSQCFPPDTSKIFPDFFYGDERRKKPVLALQGGLHGGELTGTVAILNLCQVIETGLDLRGKEWPRLAELARASRICMIPWLSPDGTDRWLLPNTEGAPAGLASACTQGVNAAGEPYRYPKSKQFFPMPLEKDGFLGSYFNDAGVNLQYDFCMPERQPETVAWMKYYLAERPDGIAIFHCNAGSMIGSPPYYLPTGFQHEYSRIGGAVRARLLQEGFDTGRLSMASAPGMGKPYLDQEGATYMSCGALPLMVELPMGLDSHPVSLDGMLDMGLITIEEILSYAHTDGLRPYEVWTKIKAKLK